MAAKEKTVRDQDLLEEGLEMATLPVKRMIEVVLTTIIEVRAINKRADHNPDALSLIKELEVHLNLGLA